jgi:hypothetical protein
MAKLNAFAQKPIPADGKPVAAQVQAVVNRKFPSGKKTSAKDKKSAARISAKLHQKSKNKTEIGF